jgi:hypothetical protein
LWTDSFGETTYSILTGYGDLDTALTTHQINTENMVKAIAGENNPNSAYAKYQAALAAALQQMGTDLGKFGEDGGTLDTHITTVTGKLGEINSAFSSWKTDADTGFAALTTAASSAYSGFAAELKKYKEDINATIALMNSLIELAGTNLPDNNNNNNNNNSDNNPT